LKFYIGRAAIIVFVTLALVSCLGPAQQKLQEGDVYFGKQEWDSAIVSYSLAGELDPQLKPVKQIAAAYIGKAKQTISAGDYESAVFNYDKAAALDPSIKAGFDLGYARYRAGLIYAGKGFNTEALQLLGAAIGGGYRKSEAYLARAHIYNLLGMHSGAIGDAATCLDLDPGSAEAYFERGYACLATAEYKKAVIDLSESIRLGPSPKEAYFYRGMAWKEMGEFKAAIADLTHVVELDPASTVALIWLGRSYYLATDYYVAIEQFTHAIELNKSDVAVALNDRAVCLGRTGQHNAAVSDLGILIKMKPAFPLSYYNLGVLYMKMAQPPAGIDNLDTYICLDVMDKFGCLGLAYSWRQQNIPYNLCCNSRMASGYVVERCSRLLAENRGGEIIPYEKDALYFGSENDLYY
jgi:tetratricopeptide (TPR) repeat protein